ncbi:hypothetical protein V9T40_014491 [Parthenolecanium corni]|uniref:Uncharacterized protein n=1 Tax=Parthenolecanium corni TaxID=536013 RepID=A0AAN9T3B8_9HEMI
MNRTANRDIQKMFIRNSNLLFKGLTGRSDPNIALCQNTTALAPQPVFAGYSLVGVYPCAVWKPAASALSAPSLTTSGHILEDTIVANCSCSGYLQSSQTIVATHPHPPTHPPPSQPPPPPGPIRAGRLASSVRSAPYPPVQLYNAPNSGLVEHCRCRAGAEELVVAAATAANATVAAEPATVSTATPPMLFVPFAFQTNYGSHHLTASPGATSLNLSNGNSISPSAPMASVAKGFEVGIFGPRSHIWQHLIRRQRSYNANEIKINFPMADSTELRSFLPSHTHSPLDAPA